MSVGRVQLSDTSAPHVGHQFPDAVRPVGGSVGWGSAGTVVVVERVELVVALVADVVATEVLDVVGGRVDGATVGGAVVGAGRSIVVGGVDGGDVEPSVTGADEVGDAGGTVESADSTRVWAGTSLRGGPLEAGLGGTLDAGSDDDATDEAPAGAAVAVVVAMVATVVVPPATGAVDGARDGDGAVPAARVERSSAAMLRSPLL
jgi:hypothetical protein